MNGSSANASREAGDLAVSNTVATDGFLRKNLYKEKRSQLESSAKVATNLVTRLVGLSVRRKLSNQRSKIVANENLTNPLKINLTVDKKFASNKYIHNTAKIISHPSKQESLEKCTKTAHNTKFAIAPTKATNKLSTIHVLPTAGPAAKSGKCIRYLTSSNGNSAAVNVKATATTPTLITNATNTTTTTTLNIK